MELKKLFERFNTNNKITKSNIKLILNALDMFESEYDYKDEYTYDEYIELISSRVTMKCPIKITKRVLENELKRKLDNSTSKYVAKKIMGDKKKIELDEMDVINDYI